MAKPIALVDEERFWRRVDRRDPSGCWVWRSKIDRYGYGRYQRRIEGKTRDWIAHRLAYQLLVGPIPDGLVLDHICRVRKCVNPAHLEPVTNQENIRRGRGYRGKPMRKVNERGVPVCVNGHEVIGDNLRLRHNPKSPALPIRDCVACSRERNRRHLARKAAA